MGTYWQEASGTGELGEAEPPPFLGTVVEEGRGSMPYSLIHDDALVACAAWAMDASGARIFDATVPWADVRDEGLPLLLHDALCPMTPPQFLAECVRRALAEDRVVVGVRPVTDTVTVVEGGRLGATVDREELVAVASPVVLPAAVVAECPAPPGPDLVDLVRSHPDALLLRAPSHGRRVASLDEVAVLEALTRVPGPRPG